MRRKTLIFQVRKQIIFILAPVFFVFLGIVLLSGDSKGMVFRVVEVNGDVEVQLPGSEWQPVKVGQEVPAGAKISTGFKSTVKLKSENSHMTVRPLSQITVAENKREGETYKTHIKLKLGKIQAKIDRVGERENIFNVATPTAVAGVRGTEELVGFSPGLGTEIELLHNSAHLENLFGEETLVGQGQQGGVGGDGDLMDPLDFARDDALPDVLPDGLSGDEEDFVDDLSLEPLSDFDEADFEDEVDDLFDDPDFLEDISGGEFDDNFFDDPFSDPHNQYGSFGEF